MHRKEKTSMLVLVALPFWAMLRTEKGNAWPHAAAGIGIYFNTFLGDASPRKVGKPLPTPTAAC
jgi:hypothetical protein